MSYSAKSADAALCVGARRSSGSAAGSHASSSNVVAWSTAVQREDAPASAALDVAPGPPYDSSKDPPAAPLRRASSHAATGRASPTEDHSQERLIACSPRRSRPPSSGTSAPSRRAQCIPCTQSSRGASSVGEKPARSSCGAAGVAGHSSQPLRVPRTSRSTRRRGAKATGSPCTGGVCISDWNTSPPVHPL